MTTIMVKKDGRTGSTDGVEELYFKALSVTFWDVMSLAYPLFSVRIKFFFPGFMLFIVVSDKN